MQPQWQQQPPPGGAPYTGGVGAGSAGGQFFPGAAAAPPSLHAAPQGFPAGPGAGAAPGGVHLRPVLPNSERARARGGLVLLGCFLIVWLAVLFPSAGCFSFPSVGERFFCVFERGGPLLLLGSDVPVGARPMASPYASSAPYPTQQGAFQSPHGADAPVWCVSVCLCKHAVSCVGIVSCGERVAEWGDGNPAGRHGCSER